MSALTIQFIPSIRLVVGVGILHILALLSVIVTDIASGYKLILFITVIILGVNSIKKYGFLNSGNAIKSMVYENGKVTLYRNNGSKILAKVEQYYRNAFFIILFTATNRLAISALMPIVVFRYSITDNDYRALSAAFFSNS